MRMCDGYLRDTYLLDASCPRFGSGEAKGIIRESVRDMDLWKKKWRSK